MPIIGKLIQKTTALSFKRNAKKGIDYRHQLEALRNTIDRAKSTKFGFVYSFHSILDKTDVVSQYQKMVPIVDYDEFHEKWLKGSIAGVKDHTWKGRIKYYALSSGTTGSPSKRIPVTTEMIRSFQRVSLRQFSILHELNLPEEFYSASVLAVGGSTKLTKKSTHIEGDLSGILKKHTSIIAAPFTKPSKKITNLKSWKEKLPLMIEEAPKWNIGIIAGIPSWCILLMEEIVKHYQLDSIHDIWPNLHVYVHGGIYMEPYRDRLEKICAHKVELLDTYLASEGYFGYQTSPNRKGMKLLMNNAIFFEFVPFNSDYFDENGELINKNKAYTISEVKEGIDYALVITTNAGLWRYLIGDLVRFVDLEAHEIIISGRIKQFLSLCGEHLSLDNINQALMKVAHSKGVSISEYTLFADEDRQIHHWYVGSDIPFDSTQIMEELDKELSLLNDDYAYVRKYNLGSPTLTIVPTETFYGFLESLGKLGAQNKMPRVLNKEQAVKWVAYLNANDYL
jgi:phenylacetate-coenzyme A ligase PaaK-like adenylate-forming protein